MGRLGWIAVAYAAGTLPSPYIVALAGGRRDVIDAMRRRDSHGDAHYLIVKQMSFAMGVVAIAVDMVKAFGPAIAVRLLTPDQSLWALVGVATVAGHCFPPYFRRSAGRGLTAAAGVSLALIPFAMVGSGLISLAGTLAKRGGPGTSIGFALLPVFAVIFGAPAPLVLMAAAIVALIAARRLEGIGSDRRAGIPLGRALVGRLVFDLPRGSRSV